jgi:RecJ-like exonuclease
MVKVYICGSTIEYDDLKIGELYKGKIVAKVKLGYLVRLNPILKGLLKFVDSKRIHEIGDEVIVKIIAIRPELGEIDLVEETPENVEEELIEKEVDVIKIKDVSEGLVRIRGQVINIIITGPTVFTITDGTSIIWASALDVPGLKAYPEINVGDYVEVIGRVGYHAERPQILISSMKKLEGIEKELVKKEIEENLEKLSQPEKIEFLIQSETLEKLKDKLVLAAKLIRKAIFTGKPILIRHHYDCDGTCGGLALETAILELVKKVNPHPEAEWYYIIRKPTKVPYYHEEDVIKDIVNAFEDNLRFNQKLPLIIVVDNGSGSEDIPAYKRLRNLGIDIIVIDHHKPYIENGKCPVDDYVLCHVNPRLHNLSGDFTAGMLATEIALLVNPNIKEKIKHLPALAGTGDRSEHPDYEKYLKIAEEKGYNKEFLKKIAECMDYEAFYLRFMSGRGFVNIIAGLEDYELCKKYVEDLYKIVKSRQERQLKVVIPHVVEKTIEDWKIIFIDVEKYAYKFEYPAPGKTVGLVKDYFDGDYPLVTIGHGPDFIIIRANKKAVEKGFDVTDLCNFLDNYVKDAGILGGGHEDAGSIKFIEGKKDEVILGIEEYFKTKITKI